MAGIKKSERKKLKENISPIDWARLAAFIDSEGCMTVLANSAQIKLGKSHLHYMKIQVVNTDARMISWIFNTFGVGIAYEKPKSPSIADEAWRSIYIWSCESVNAAKILEGCLPYFIIKREQAELCIEFQKTKGLYHSRGRLAERVPDNVISFRESIKTLLKDLKRPDHNLEIA